MDDLTAYAWECLAREYTAEIETLLKQEAAEQAACQTGCCGLPLPELRRNKHQRAIYAHEQSIKWGGTNPKTYYRIYWHHHYLSQFEAGAEACRQALALDGSYALAAGGLAHCLKALGRYADAAEALERALELKPGDINLLEALLFCHLFLDRKDDELQVTLQAMEQHPDHIPFLRHRYNQLEKQERYEEALALAERARELTPESFAPHVALGHAYEHLGRKEKALDSFSEALRLAPGDTSALHPLVQLMGETGREAEIPKLLKAQVTEGLNNAVEGSGIGKLLCEYGCYESAVRVLTQVCEDAPYLVDSYARLAQAQRVLGRNKEAEEVLKAGVKAAIASLEKLQQTLPVLVTLDENPGCKPYEHAKSFETYTYENALLVYLDAGELELARPLITRLEELAPERAPVYRARLTYLEGR